jgi:hypothetical protein
LNVHDLCGCKGNNFPVKKYDNIEIEELKIIHIA